jgi:hypothetical protein
MQFSQLDKNVFQLSTYVQYICVYIYTVLCTDVCTSYIPIGMGNRHIKLPELTVFVSQLIIIFVILAFSL